MSSSVRSADRTLAIFEAFDITRKQMLLGDIAEHCDMPLSTCHALVQTLLKRGYLYTMGKRKELYPTIRLLKMAENIAAHDPFISRISETLIALSADCGETVTVGKRQGDSVLYLDAIDGTHAIRYAARAGEYKPLYATALGKALLSELDEAALAHWLSGQTFQKITAKTITTKSRLLSDIEEGRKKSYFIASGELTDDLTTVAVPLKRHSEPLAISITGPTHRVMPLIESFGKKLMKAKRVIEDINDQ